MAKSRQSRRYSRNGSAPQAKTSNAARLGGVCIKLEERQPVNAGAMGSLDEVVLGATVVVVGGMTAT